MDSSTMQPELKDSGPPELPGRPDTEEAAAAAAAADKTGGAAAAEEMQQAAAAAAATQQFVATQPEAQVTTEPQEAAATAPAAEVEQVQGPEAAPAPAQGAAVHTWAPNDIGALPAGGGDGGGAVEQAGEAAAAATASTPQDTDLQPQLPPTAAGNATAAPGPFTAATPFSPAAPTAAANSSTTAAATTAATAASSTDYHPPGLTERKGSTTGADRGSPLRTSPAPAPPQQAEAARTSASASASVIVSSGAGSEPGSWSSSKVMSKEQWRFLQDLGWTARPREPMSKVRAGKEIEERRPLLMAMRRRYGVADDPRRKLRLRLLSRRHQLRIQADPLLAALYAACFEPGGPLCFNDASELLRVGLQRPLDAAALGAALAAIDANIRADKDGPPTPQQLQQLEELRQALELSGTDIPEQAVGTPATYLEAMYKISFVIQEHWLKSSK
ncbi:hypothetical protein HYH02_011283 [Chlamydomonas schloesseri]|uniref:Uncharacterized protein n=1 Tax=Chlamydomonas schloesseri TaxID=2026947 RepID=A0A835TC40_9CHLO|nr:hypothetical protein HYH02_011283 [Chlamydomonas schloesseri]|eukprot:KAG2437644.1 hypothetical protein HYH02_011283 [Chlamydomonas schloesseri]